MLVCNCGREAAKASSPDAQVDICEHCGKRVTSGRSGTLTQWIFRADLCTCDNPLVLPSAKGRRSSYSSDDKEEADESGAEPSGLEVDSRFPAERYTPLRLLGSGASGSVYLCRDKLLAKRVAVKVLNNLSEEDLIAFQNEAKATSHLHHENIVKVLDFGVVDFRSPYMVLEYLPGASLDKLLATEGPLEPEAALEIFQQISDALSYLHIRGIFHRDLKPSNIIISSLHSDEPTVRIIDFSIGVFKGQADSKGSRGSFAGTPTYMSPELARGERFEITSEVYSFGCVLFEALTGRPPFKGERSIETISMHAHEPVPLLSDYTLMDVSDRLDSLIRTCMAKLQADRYQSFEEVRNAIIETQQVLQEMSNTGSDISLPSETAATRRVGGPLLIGILLLTGTVFGTMAIQNNTPSGKINRQSANARHVPKLKDVMATIDTFKWRRGFDNAGNEGWVSGTSVTDEDFKELRKEHEVSYIIVTVNDSVTGSGLRYLADRAVRGVSLQSTAINDEGLSWISKVKSLQTLRISLTGQLTVAGFKHLLDLPLLCELDTCVLSLPEGAIDVIAQIKAMRILSLYNAKHVTTEDVGKIRSLPLLHFIDLSGTDLTNEIIPILASMKNLREIRLARLNLTDENLEMLSKLPNLARLDLSNTPITNRGLEKISACRRLKTISLQGCRNVTGAGIGRLRKTLPRLKILRSNRTQDVLIDSLSPLEKD